MAPSHEQDVMPTIMLLL